MGFEPTCPCGQLHFECSSLQPLRYASMYKYSLSRTNHMISSQPRYDHFDTSPCEMVCIIPHFSRRRNTLSGIFSTGGSSAGTGGVSHAKTCEYRIPLGQPGKLPQLPGGAGVRGPASGGGPQPDGGAGLRRPAAARRRRRSCSAPSGRRAARSWASAGGCRPSTCSGAARCAAAFPATSCRRGIWYTLPVRRA